MPTQTLQNYIVPLLHGKDVQHLNTIRPGIKSLAYWPYRYLTNPDSRLLLDLLTEVTQVGKHLTIQPHFSYPCELEA